MEVWRRHALETLDGSAGSVIGYVEKFNGHFLGVHAHYADYNVGGIKFLSKNMENYRYQGNLYGAGLSYGYQWLLSKPLEHGGCDRCRMGASGL